MSVIGKKPFVNDILDNCSSGQLETLASLLDDLGSPTLVSLFGVENVISSANLGVSHVVFKLEQVSNKIVEGILVYIDASHCGLFAVNDTTGVLGEFKIDPVNKKYWQILEHLTAEEFRQVVADFLGGGGGVTLNYATNAEIDALFGEPVEYATFEVGTLTNCSLSGISDGDQIVVGQSLTFRVTGTENNMVGASILNNGIAYTTEEIGSMVTAQGDNWFEFTIPVVNGDIVVSFEFQGDEPTEYRIRTREMFGCHPSVTLPETIAAGESLQFEVVPDYDPYKISFAMIYMGEDEVTNQVFDRNTMMINIPSVTGEVDIAITCVEDISVESIEFTNLPEDHAIELNVGDVVDMSQYIEVSPADATDKSYTLTTDAPSVLSVNGTTITVLQGSEGLNANLTVTANDGSGCSDTMIVQVLNGEDEEDVPIESIRYTDGQGNTCIGFGMLEGETVDLWENLEITPSDATDGIEFVSSDDAVISVDGTGIATAVGTVGENAIITIRSMENANISTTVAIDISEEEEPVSEIAVSFYSDGLNSTGLDWDGQIIEPDDNVDVSFTANNLVSNSRFIDIEDIVPDFSVEVTNDGNEDTGATITRTGSGMNTQWRVQTVAQGDVEVIVNYNPVTFNDDVFSGNHALYTNMTQVDFANLGSASIASSFSRDDVWDSYNTQLDVNTHAIPLYSPDGFYNQVLQSEIIANPAQHKGFWLYIDQTTHNPVVCCVHGTEGAVASMNDFESFNVLDQQSGQSLDCIKKFKDENFNGDINVANFFFEDLRGEISGTGQCFLFYDKSGS